jgi:hypothetical protein
VHACPRKWTTWLATAEFWYNTCFHSSLGRTPFEALYGRQPRTLGIEPPVAAEGKLDSWLTERSNMHHLIQEHLNRAVSHMKIQADKKRSEREFSMGSMVYLKLQPYVQSSVMPTYNHKLCFKYFSPYKILSRVGAVAYRLQLPSTSAIHRVVHVSQLKPATGFKGMVAGDLQVLETRMISKGSAQVAQVKVLWSGMTDLATWEDLDALKQQFPRAPAWGQAVTQEGGNVSTRLLRKRGS